MSSKYPIESNLINVAREEFLKNGRSKRFVELEDEIINTCYFRDICEFAFSCKGADIKKIESSLTAEKGLEYFGGFYFLARYVKGSNYKLLEKLFIKHCNSLNVVREELAWEAINFALNFNEADANELFKIVLKTNLLPYEKCLIARQIAHKHDNLDVNLFKKFIAWCEIQDGDKLFRCYINELKNKLVEIEAEQGYNY